MKIWKKLCSKSICMAILALGSAFGASAQSYPGKTVRLVVAYPAGGAVDGAVRIIAERLQTKWRGNTVIVENKPGASGRVAMAFVAKTAADGYTFVAVTNSTISDELLQSSDPHAFKASRELQPVVTFFDTPVVLAVNTETGINSLGQYIQYAKAHPGKLSFGTTGQATSTHFYGEILKKEAGIEITHVPFSGEGPNVTDLLGGHVSSSFISMSGARKVLPTGKVKLLAITTTNRSELLPDLPSFEEQGIKGINLDSWAGFLAPKGTPDAILNQFSANVREILESPDVQRRFTEMGLLAKGSTPASFATRINQDRDYWAKALKITGIQLN